MVTPPPTPHASAASKWLGGMHRALAALALALATFAAAASAQTPEPLAPAKASIFVRTAFPLGATANGAMDVEYDAEPGGGAHIAQVAYSINGGPWEYVYLRGGGVSQKGSLGRARVMLAPGENRIAFRAIDSAGNTATCAVPGAPFYDFGAPPDRAGASLAPSAVGGGVQYATDCIVAIARNGATDAQVAQAAQAIGGAIAGRANPVGMYWLRVPGGTEAQLMDICARLLADHPDVFAAASLDTLHPIDVPEPDGGARSPAAAQTTDDPWWGGSEWGLTAMKVPDAWEAYQGALHETKVAVVDNGFRTTHDDLQLQADNVYNRNIANKGHGSHVIGTIGAVHNNAKGLAGVMDAQRASLYGYDAFATTGGAYSSDIIAGLGWNAANGAKAINFSLGAGNGGVAYSPAADALYSAAMRNLLNQGYDFVVVHSAGNETVDAIRNSIFSHVTDPELRKRIITVGAANSSYQLAYFTNYGPLVDVVAPGVNIYSSTASSDSSYANYSGTSMAAPHVTGLVGLVWSADPGLTGDVVKAAIVDSAHESGRAIADTRSNIPADERLTYYLTDAKAAMDKAIGGAGSPVAGVTLSKASATIGVGGTLTLIATVLPSNAANKSVTWQSSNTAVATVANGLVMGMSAGAADITVTTMDGGKTATCSVTVVAGDWIPATSISLSATSMAIPRYASETLVATVLPDNATDNGVAWWSSNDGIASVSDGVVTGHANGAAMITATTMDGGVRASCSVTVVAPISISIYPKTATLTHGSSRTFTATVTGGTGNTAVTWTASGGSVTQGGAYTAPAISGAYTVTATSQENPSRSASATVTVIHDGTVTIVNPPKGLFMDGTATFHASVELLANDVTWTATGGTMDPQSGEFTAPGAPGTVTITAASVQEPLIKASVQVKVSTAFFDENTETDPQLLRLAKSFGSAARSDLDKYDFDGSGRVDDGDLDMLFAEMGW